MSTLPNLFVTRFDGLTKPLPLVVQAIDSPDKITVRTWREIEDSKTKLSDIDVNRHADVVPARTFGEVVIDGALLASRLDGLAFEELGAVCLDIDCARDLHEWSDMARWMFRLDSMGVPTVPFNVRALTLNNKVTGTRHLQVSQNDCALVVFVYFAHLDFTEASFLVVGHPAHGAVGTLADRARIIDPKDQVHYSVKSEPRIILSGPESIPAGGEVDLDLKLTSSGGRGLTAIDTEVYMETTGGHLPLLRVPIVGGKGSLRVAAPWNRPGDTFKVKAGFRHVTGLAEHALTVA